MRQTIIMNQSRITNVADETPYGFDLTAEGRRVWYFIQTDIFGDGRCLAIWNPGKILQSYSSFKEALVYLAMARQKMIFQKGKARIVRSFTQCDYKNYEVIEIDEENIYYTM